tara:strand:+ start:444 stop:620 length:177 start_codon:yes stop_codon:yes gene_type:complete
MYTVGPEQEPESEEDTLSYFEEGWLGRLPIIQQAIEAVRAYNERARRQEEAYNKAFDR